MGKLSVSEPGASNESKYSIFQLAGYIFGLTLSDVKEIVPLPRITGIPNVHPSILGVFNLRGQIISILDLRRLLNLEINPVSTKSFILIITLKNMFFGIYVDKVLDVLSVDELKIQIPTRDLALPFLSYVKGVYEDKRLGNIYMMDIEAIINSKEVRQYRF